MRQRLQNRNENGFFTIWVLGMCVLLFFIGGLSIDLWKGFTERRNLAEIADGAAVAGASKIDLNCFRQDDTSTTLVLNGAPGANNCDSDPDAVVDPETAKARAEQYIQTAITQDQITLVDQRVGYNNGQLVVELWQNSDTTLTRILAPNEKENLIHVQSAAVPQRAN